MNSSSSVTDDTTDSAESARARAVVGRVVSNKMNQSVSVVIERLERHPVYGKFVRRTTKVLAHDQDNACKEGDTVAIVECRPLSKRKTWRVIEVIETTDVVD